MPIDGSYGRLSAHKQRMQDFKRRKESQRKKLKAFRLTSKDKLDFDTPAPSKVLLTKRIIRHQLQRANARETLLLIASILIIAVLFYWFFAPRF